MIIASSVPVKITTKMYGYEISWQLVEKDTMAIACEGGHYASNSMATKTCDLKPDVEYELKCEDEWGDGWNEGSNRLKRSPSSHKN